GHHHVQD
ncbi:putative host specificity protein, partial [Escherichia coli NE037]